MANINSGINSVSGMHGTPNSCGDVGIHDLRNSIDKVFVAGQNGSSYITQKAKDANGLFAVIKNFECGGGYIFFRNPQSSSTFNIPHFVQGNIENSQQRVVTFYPVEFSIENHGTFHITTKFEDDAPTYELANGSKAIWFNGNSYVLSSSVGNSTDSLKNDSVLPNAPYGENNTSSSTIEISDFTGNSAAANGLYAEVGYLNDQKLYRLASTGLYFYFFDGSAWNLTDTPVNTSGGACFIKGTSQLTGRLDNANGSNGNCFDGQTGRVMEGGMDPRSLATEDELKLLSTEDKLKILITEED
jgi:hypothetical protein